MKGHIIKRGSKYSFVIDISPHPETGARRQRWFSGYKTKKEAQADMAKKIVEIEEGSYIEPTKMRVREFFLQYLEARKINLRETTYYNYRKHINNHIIPKLGNIPMQKLKGVDLEKFYGDLSETMKPVTVRSIHQIVRTALTYAVRHEIVKKNIADVISPPTAGADARTVNTWTEEEVLLFLENAKESRYYIAYLLAITCGMRKGEILGLQWKDIDFERRTLSVNRSLSHITKEFHEPKTSSGKRLIVLPEITLQALQEHLQRINEEKARYGDGYNNFDLVCPTYNGNPCNFRSLTQLWKKLIKKCGVPDIRFHDLRHTHATLMLKQGIHPKIVSERLGHKKVGITLDTYSHVVPGLQEKAVEDFANNLFQKH
ncbi:site-specific integrase [Bacillus mobilis]|uniref:Site-specific integrase n=4 Tax=Bacillus cereus group TaxID=86661 RepID=A0A1C4C8K2_BACCE|nr:MULTISPECIES: site-specific integrase [Bacillus cereus group]OKA34412.1 site-specific integrase [Bacillus cereus]OKA38181.1 site-specific integrase [Bacillus cereus]SCC15469.1 DNA integration/recombination/inversion protein [Bacillus mobilis]